MVDRSEKILADGSYKDNNQYFETPSGLNNATEQMKAHARARHETCNRCFKQFGALSQWFGHPRKKHGIVFTVVAQVTQLAIMYDQPLFDVEYSEF